LQQLIAVTKAQEDTQNGNTTFEQTTTVTQDNCVDVVSSTKDASKETTSETTNRNSCQSSCGSSFPVLPTSPRINRMISRSGDDVVSDVRVLQNQHHHQEQHDNSSVPIYASVNKESKKQCSQSFFVPSSCNSSTSSNVTPSTKGSVMTTGNGMIMTTVLTTGSSPAHSYKSNGKSSSSRKNSCNISSLRRNNDNNASLFNSNVNQTKRNKTSTEETVVHNSRHVVDPILAVVSCQSPSQSDQRTRYCHTSSSCNEATSSVTPASDGIPQSSKISSSGYNSHEESDREIPSSRDERRVIEKKSSLRESNNKSDGKADKKNSRLEHNFKQDQSISINQNRGTSSSVKIRSKSKDVQTTSKSSSSSHHRQHHQDSKRDSIASVSEQCSLLCCKFFK
jgi:hypothetical protein